MKKGCRNMYKVYNAQVISSFYICISRANLWQVGQKKSS